jgi:DNA-binding transcriptional regulator GbsR (MarR family)
MTLPVTPNPNSHPLLEEVHDDMLSGLGQLANYFGFGKVMGQIFGALLMSAQPLSLDDLVERLDISKANVSINMRTLENLGMVREVHVKGGGGRRKFYKAEADFWQIVSTILQGREMRDVGRAISVMDDNIRRLKAEIPTLTDEQRQTAAVYMERMEQMRVLFEFARMMIQAVLAQVGDAAGEGQRDTPVPDDDWTPD